MNVSPLLKAALTPGSIAFLVLCLALWLVLKFVWPKTQGVARSWLYLVAGTYLVLGLPVVASSIAGRLPHVPPADLEPGRHLDTLLVFDGDNRRGRVEETLRVFRAAYVGAVVILGEAWIKDELSAAGIPGDRLKQERGPSTTRGQVEWVRQFLERQPGGRTALIASRLQMPRVAALVRAHGLALILVPSPIDSEPPTAGALRFIPSYVALRTSRDSLYEHAALVFCRWRGWTE